MSAVEDFKYHENEGLVGWILLTARLSLFAWFRSGSLAAERSREWSCGRHISGALEGIQRLRSAGPAWPSFRLIIVRAVRARCSSGGIKLQNFLQIFEIAGSAYFLAFPTIFVLVQDGVQSSVDPPDSNQSAVVV